MPSRYHSTMVNSGLWRRPRSPSRNTCATWNTSGAPAHNSRFIAYSGEVCRNPTREPSLRRTSSDSRCTSVTAARTSTGVSTSSAPVRWKWLRTTPSSRARSRNVSSAAVGRHEPGAGWFIP